MVFHFTKILCFDQIHAQADEKGLKQNFDLFHRSEGGGKNQKNLLQEVPKHYTVECG